MVGICLRLFAYSLPQLLQSDGDSCHVSLPRFSVTKCRSDGLLCSVSQLVCHHSLRAQARSHRVTGGSLLLRAQRPPSGLQSALPPLTLLRKFLSGTRRASPAPSHPFSACCRHYPAGANNEISPCSRCRCCLRQCPRGSATGACTHEACSTFDTCGPQSRSRTLGPVCRKAPRPSFVGTCLSCYMVSAPCHDGTFTR